MKTHQGARRSGTGSLKNEAKIGEPIEMVVLTANTPEEFIVEQLQQRHGMSAEQAAEALEGLKERGLYDEVLTHARAAFAELNALLQRATPVA